MPVEPELASTMAGQVSEPPKLISGSFTVRIHVFTQIKLDHIVQASPVVVIPRFVGLHQLRLRHVPKRVLARDGKLLDDVRI